MIIFELGCAAAHRFEGWFASSDDFQAQRAAGQIACPVCGSDAVARIPTARIGKSREALSPAANSDPKAVASPGTGSAQSKPQAAFAAFIEHVLVNSEDVGSRFADEARKIHSGQSARRAIRGTASAVEAKALIEDGIPVLALPVPPKDSWH